MKYLIAFIIMTSVYCAEWNNPALPMASPEKPVYQWTGWPPPGNMWIGGKCSKVRIPTTEDLKEQLDYELQKRLQDEQIKQVQLAGRLMLYGLIAAIACAVVNGCSSLPQIKRLSEWGIIGGIVSISGGIGYKWILRHEVAIDWAVGLAIGSFIIYKVLTHEKISNWSISHLFKKKKKGNDHDQ